MIPDPHLGQSLCFRISRRKQLLLSSHRFANRTGYTALSIKAYRSLRPLIRDAYRELGYPTQDFQDTLIRAVDELLQVPLVRA